MGFLNPAEPCGSGPSVNGREGAAKAGGGEAFADLCIVLCSDSIVLRNRRGSVMRAGNQRGPVSPATARGQCLWDHKECMRSYVPEVLHYRAVYLIPGSFERDRTGF